MDNITAAELSPIERIKTSGALVKKQNELIQLAVFASPIERIKISGEIVRLCGILTGKYEVKTEPARVAVVERSEEPAPERIKKSLTQRQKANNAAIDLLRQIEDGAVQKPLTSEQKQVLSQYSGSGGGLKAASGEAGSPYEYYTPKPVAQGVWDLLGGMGFKGGKVLDPSAGMGVFAQTKPSSVAIDQVELDGVSGMINGLINDDATVSVQVSPYEAVAASTEDAQYDAIVTNVPFGNHSMRGSTYKLDKAYQKADMQTYFILRTMSKLKFGGFMAFIVPTSIVSGKDGKSLKLRNAISFGAEFIGAYRLPNQVFDEAGADVVTDVIILRKHSKSQTEKIEELKKQNAALLTQANVLWGEFLSGNYFKMSGKKYQIGESQMAMGKFGEVEKVVHAGDIGSVAKLMRPFDEKGRIDWALLDGEETIPDTFNEGDTVYMDGALLQMVDGVMVTVDGGLNNADHEAEALKDKMGDPFSAINNGVTYDDAVRVVNNETREGRINDLVLWVRQAVRAANGDVSFKSIVSGMCVYELAQKNGKLDGTKYNELYPALTKVLGSVKSDAKKLRTGESNPEILKALESVERAATKSGFTNWWLGVAASMDEVLELTPSKAYEREKYNMQDGVMYVSVDAMKAHIPNFDPFSDEFSKEWCISPDGKGVLRAGDYYYGSYAEFLARAQVELSQTSDPVIKERLLNQHALASERLSLIDVSDMALDLHTPYADVSDKLEYLQQYVSSEYELSLNDKGERSIKFTGKSYKYASDASNLERKLKARLAYYVTNGTIRTGNKLETEEDKVKDAAMQRELSAFVMKANNGFEAWAKANESIRAGINEKLNAPEKLQFTETLDYEPLDIDGWNTERKPHGYQSAAIRKFSKRFSGILGHDVGLGKTLGALAAVQYSHSIGVKKRTMFAIPNNVFSNWKKEAEMSLNDTSGCLYVGYKQGKNGALKYDSATVDEDLAKVPTGQYSKIFLTYEALGKIPMREETEEKYAQSQAFDDDSFGDALIEASEKGDEKGTKARDRIAQESAIQKALSSGKKSVAVPYFEDMGIDSIVIDEAHAFKNSAMFSNKGDNGFAPTKYVPNAGTSDRGLDINMKCWYVRGSTPNGDGIMAMTATPVTNSPLEIYAMLSLSVGKKEVNEMMGCTGANSFMNAVCEVGDEAYQTITDEQKTDRVLTGIKNLKLVQRLIDSTCVIETVDTVAEKGIYIQVPESEESVTSIELPNDVTNQLRKMKDNFQELGKKKRSGNLTPTEAVQASPFNLIRSMTKLISDKELFEGEFKFTFEQDDAAAVKKAVDAFNAKKYTEERKEHELPYDFDLSGVKSKTITDDETGGETVVYYVPIVAVMSGNTITLPSVTYKVQDSFVALLDKFDVTPVFTEQSPKMSALIANVRNENACPRWKPAKQIIFCDELALHHKLRFLIANETGIPKGKIVIVNAVSMTPSKLQDMQDGFNANGEDGAQDANQYQIIIANKKAEVGINLQKGTQAIHHFTIGWTPDSTHQRNGRGVRQGNAIDTPIMIYHYEANGTFDNYKRNLVSVKSDWIDSLTDKSAKRVDIQSGLTREDEENLINCVGDSEAMARIQSQASARAQAKIAQVNKQAQVNAVGTMQASKAWIDRFGESDEGFHNWLMQKRSAIATLNGQMNALERKKENVKSEAVLKRLNIQISTLRTKKFEIDQYIERGEFAAMNGWALAKLIREKNQELLNTNAYKNWQKELRLNESMCDEARNAFLLRDNFGYSKTALEKLETEQAIIMGGKILALGDVIEDADGNLGVLSLFAGSGSLKNKDLQIMLHYAQTHLTRFVFARDLNFVRHGSVGTAEHAQLCKELAQVCDAMLEAKPDTAHGAWEYCPEVLESMSKTVATPNISVFKGYGSCNYAFKSPLFPLYIDKYMGVGFEKEQAEQQALITVVDEGHSVRVNDARSVFLLSGDNGEKSRLLKSWLEANQRKVRFDAEVAEYLGLYDYTHFDKALTHASSIAKTIEQYKQVLFDTLSELAPLVDFVDFETILANRAYARTIQATLTDLDDGSSPYEHEIYTHQLPDFTQILCDAASKGIVPLDIEWYITSQVDERLRVIAKACGAKIDGDKLKFKGELADKLRNECKVGQSAQPFYDVAQFVNGRASLKIDLNRLGAHLNKEAQKGKAAEQTGDLDANAILEAVRGLDGVTNASICDKTYIRQRTRFAGGASVDAFMYLVVDLQYKSDLQSKISDGKDGLNGRHFDGTTKQWYFPIVDVKLSDGKDWATVKDLLQFIGKTELAEQLFGGK